jgi:hypothetical protein
MVHTSLTAWFSVHISSAHDVLQTDWLLLFTSGAQKKLNTLTNGFAIGAHLWSKKLMPSQTDSSPPCRLPSHARNLTPDKMIRSWCSPLPQERNSRPRQTDSPLVSPLPAKKTYYADKLTRSGACLCPLKETQLYCELIYSWCPPLSHEGNSIVLRIDSLPVPTSAPWQKLSCITNWFALGAHLCPSISKETECIEELFRSWCPSLLPKDGRNWIPWSTIHSWRHLCPKAQKKYNPLAELIPPLCPPLPHKHKRYIILCQIPLMPASGAQKPLHVLTKLSFLMPTSAPQSPKKHIPVSTWCRLCRWKEILYVLTNGC